MSTAQQKAVSNLARKRNVTHQKPARFGLAIGANHRNRGGSNYDYLYSFYTIRSDRLAVDPSSMTIACDSPPISSRILSGNGKSPSRRYRTDNWIVGPWASSYVHIVIDCHHCRTFARRSGSCKLET